MLNANVADALPIMNSIRTIIDLAGGIHGVIITANPSNINAENIKFRRPKRLSKSPGNSAPGISTACTIIKLMYRFPGICVDIMLKP